MNVLDTSLATQNVLIVPSSRCAWRLSSMNSYQPQMHFCQTFISTRTARESTKCRTHAVRRRHHRLLLAFVSTMNIFMFIGYAEFSMSMQEYESGAYRAPGGVAVDDLCPVRSFIGCLHTCACIIGGHRQVDTRVHGRHRSRMVGDIGQIRTWNANERLLPATVATVSRWCTVPQYDRRVRVNNNELTNVLLQFSAVPSMGSIRHAWSVHAWQIFNHVWKGQWKV
jgi:hypothetical protein